MTATTDTTYSVNLTVDIDGTDTDLAHNLDQIDQAISVLRDARSELAQTLFDRHGHHTFDVDGLGRVEIRRGRNRTEWDREQLLSKVRTSRILDSRTGELESELDAVLAVWNLPAPRTTVLKARGIDPDEYCASAPSAPQVKIVGDQ